MVKPKEDRRILQGKHRTSAANNTPIIYFLHLCSCILSLSPHIPSSSHCKSFHGSAKSLARLHSSGEREIDCVDVGGIFLRLARCQVNSRSSPSAARCALLPSSLWDRSGVGVAPDEAENFLFPRCPRFSLVSAHTFLCTLVAGSLSRLRFFLEAAIPSSNSYWESLRGRARRAFSPFEIALVSLVYTPFPLCGATPPFRIRLPLR